MKDPLVLAFDFGTQSVRASLINKKGEIEGMAKVPYVPLYYSSQSGYAEQDPDFYFENAKQAAKILASKHTALLSRIVAGTITCFRDSSVQLNNELKPIRKTILWLDQRLARADEKIPRRYSFLFKLVGMKPTIELNRSRTVAHWLKENEPETWEKTYKYVNISTYLTYKLTGRLIDSAASYAGHYPICFKKRKWYKENHMKAIIFGIPSRMLCDLIQPGETLGMLSDSFADEVGLPRGIRMIATGSDKACETIGLNALSRDVAAVSYGTACSIEVSNTKYYEPEPFLPAYPAATKNWYNMEVQVYRGYWMLTWFTKQFASELIDEAKLQKMAVEELLNEGLAKVKPGSEGLVLQPYWGPGLSRPLAKGAIVGFSDVHTRDHLYRAIIEGIAYALKEGLEGIEKSQLHSVKEIRVSGGGSQSPAICQITADIFNLPVSRVQTYETTSLGAAISTFHAIGEFKTIQEAMDAMSHVSKTFTPNPTAVEQYEYLYKKVYLSLFPQLKDVYRDLNKYSKRIK